MKKTKQILSILLALVMLTTSLISVNISALAEDLFKNAEVIELNKSIEASGEGYFKTTTTENGILNIVFAHNQVDEAGWWNISLYHKDKYGTYSELQPEKLITVGDASSVHFREMMIEPMTVYIKVVPSDNANLRNYRIFSEFEQTYGDYETEFNNTMETADEIAVNGCIHANSWEGDNTDWFKITTDEAGKLEIVFAHDQIDIGGWWYLTFYKKGADGKLFEIVKHEYIINEETAHLVPMGLEAGEYYIELDTTDSNEDYSIYNTFTPIQNNEFESEYNDTTETADVLNLNGSITANSWDNDQVDWYKLKTTKKGIVSIAFNHDQTDKAGWWYLTFYKKSVEGKLNAIITQEFTVSEPSTSMIPMGLDAGEYYIEIDTSSAKEEYTLSNTFTAITNNEFESEFNDTFATADKINLNGKITANSYQDDNYDYFKVTTNKHGNLTVKFLHDYEDSWDYWNVSIYKKDSKGNYNEISKFESIQLSNDVASSVTVRNLNAGTYYISVDNSNAKNHTYSIQTKLTHTHSYKVSSTVKATTKKNGKINYVCSDCDATKSTTIDSIKSVALSKTSYVYDGKAKKPTVTVKNSKGNKISSKYYTASYQSGRKNVGKYIVTIKFKGNYSGTVKKTFVIKPKATSISDVTAKSKSFTVKWKKQAVQTTGYEIQYSTSSKFTSPKILTVGSNKTTSKKISNLKAKKKYYVRIRTYKTVNGTKYYSSWSKYKSVTTK